MLAMKAAFLVSVSAASLLLASAASAQDAPLAPGTAAQQAQPAPGGSPSEDAAGADEIVVTGVRAAIVGALNVKRDSVQIVDSIVAEDVGKLPDNNVVEALQRVTGVQVTDRGNAEAGALSIRGLTDPLTTLNGRIIFTTTGQSFALQDIPANLVSTTSRPTRSIRTSPSSAASTGSITRSAPSAAIARRSAWPPRR